MEFLEEELNQLHHEKLKNEKKAKEEFDQRVKNAKYKAIEENIKKASASGNMLTQTINEEGELVGANTINYEEREMADESVNKHIRDELFQNDSLLPNEGNEDSSPLLSDEAIDSQLSSTEPAENSEPETA